MMMPMLITDVVQKLPSMPLGRVELGAPASDLIPYTRSSCSFRPNTYAVIAAYGNFQMSECDDRFVITSL